MNERREVVERSSAKQAVQSKLCVTGKLISGVSEQSNGQASGPVFHLDSWFFWTIMQRQQSLGCGFLPTETITRLGWLASVASFSRDVMNERMDERVAQYSRLDFLLFWSIVLVVGFNRQRPPPGLAASVASFSRYLHMKQMTPAGSLGLSLLNAGNEGKLDGKRRRLGDSRWY